MFLEDIEVLDIYKILGGIPYYLSLLSPAYKGNENIDNLLFNKKAELKNEYNYLINSLFENSDNYRFVIEKLANKLHGMTRNEIANEVKLEGGNLTNILENLVNCDFLMCFNAFGKKEKNKIYQLIDPFTLFYLRFVKDNYPSNNYWSNSRNNGKVNAWNGYAFEQVCFMHIEQIKKSLGISGVTTSISSWHCDRFFDKDGVEHNGSQIDLVINRDDNVINLCEMKYSNDNFILTSDYIKLIKERNQNFKLLTKTKKAIRTTFITTFGLSNSKNNYYIDNAIKLESLFEKE